MMTLLKRFFPIFIAASMLFAIGCASTSTHESTGEYIDDTTITTKVKAAIFNEPSLSVAQISVTTNKGVVQLSGFVNSSADIRTAGSVARSVKGVVSGDNDLRLKYPRDAASEPAAAAFSVRHCGAGGARRRSPQGEVHLSGRRSHVGESGNEPLPRDLSAHGRRQAHPRYDVYGAGCRACRTHR